VASSLRKSGACPSKEAVQRVRARCPRKSKPTHREKKGKSGKGGEKTWGTETLFLMGAARTKIENQLA